MIKSSSTSTSPLLKCFSLRPQLFRQHFLPYLDAQSMLNLCLACKNLRGLVDPVASSRPSLHFSNILAIHVLLRSAEAKSGGESLRERAKRVQRDGIKSLEELCEIIGHDLPKYVTRLHEYALAMGCGSQVIQLGSGAKDKVEPQNNSYFRMNKILFKPEYFGYTALNTQYGIDGSKSTRF